MHDGEKAHSPLIKETGSTEKVIPTWMTKGAKDEANPMGEINRVHRFFKRFLSLHLGFDRDDSQDWVNLFWVSMSYRPLEIAAKYVIGRMISTKKVVRYRDFYGKTKKKLD